MPLVESGLDVLVRRRPSLLRGQRVALLTHQASVDSRYEHAVTLLRDLRGVKVRRLLAPEHGLWGAPQDHAWIDGARDPVTGLAVFSLYGARREPTQAMLDSIDAVVVDLQDVGSRYYTFVWTMALAMQACAKRGVRVVVLDRPNPLGGALLEGNVADPSFASFVGLYPLPIRHGMTIAELASYLNVCPETVRALARNGDLPPPVLKTRRLQIWDLDQVDAHLAARQAGGQSHAV